MHVTFVVVGHRGGMIHYPANLINSLSEECDISVIAITRNTSELPDLIHTEDIIRIDIGTAAGVYDLYKKGYGLSKLLVSIRRNNPDIVHIPFYSGATMFLPAALSLIGCKIVATVHDPQNKQGLNTRYSIRWTQFDSRFMDAILVHGKRTVKQAINSKLPDEKLRQIPHGLYPHFRSEPVKHTNEEVLFFGTIRKDKGACRIPAIAEQVIEESNVNVRVAGALSSDGWGRQVLDQLQKMDRVVVDEGYIPNDEVQSYFERAAVVVLPYVDATTSGVLLTAYTFDTPVVVTDTGDLGWRVQNEDTGLVADPDSVADIAEKTLSLLETDLWKTKRANIKNVKSQYQWEYISDELVKIYRTVIDSETET